jgi:hypothetical protein
MIRADPEEERPCPALPLAAWDETRATLHLWTQAVGKARLALAPTENHWWDVPLYVTARGLHRRGRPRPRGRQRREHLDRIRGPRADADAALRPRNRRRREHLIIYNASPDRETALAEAGAFPSAPARATALSAMRSNRG